MKKMLVLIGLQCSGKSTFALDLVKRDPNFVRVNRDDIRLSLFNTEFDLRIEPFVSKVQDFLIKTALGTNQSVVIDNCNIDPKYRNDLYKIAKDIGDVLYEEKVFNTSLEECLARNEKRERKVPVDVIEKYAKKGRVTLWGNYKPKIEFLPKMMPETVILNQSQDLPRAIMVDLDGTMAIIHKGRDPYDASTCDRDIPNTPVIESVKALNDQGYEVIFCSGREDKYREPTVAFLNMHFVGDEKRSYTLLMRKSGDQRKDSIIKEEIYNKHIKDKYNILCVFDDRNQVVDKWREMGLTCFQVAPGNF